MAVTKHPTNVENKLINLSPSIYLILYINTQPLIKQTTKENPTPSISIKTITLKESPHPLKNSHSTKVIVLVYPLDKNNHKHKHLNNKLPLHTKTEYTELFGHKIFLFNK
jgi:hypothetical protein